jgi:hypothetical protein
MSLPTGRSLYSVTPPEEGPKATGRAFIVDLRADRVPDLETVDALARLQLLAKQLDVTLLVWTEGDALRRLIRLAGLDEVLTCVGPLEVESLRQSEPPEQFGVEEVVDVEDPPA